ncbi:hypothetical protein CRE_25527 [Caenorhabditis remanei]|uniref:C-type lectin domain-containing protein n=1 Tax=Caenorhabditis remanei TaxID=31234 RepID=E3LS28_CAERE|nr:hypothetical protein CRE_25527 [Caenorhabditis remanei]
MIRYHSLLLLILPVFVNAQCDLGSVYNSDKNVCFTFYNASVDFKTAESICTISSGHLASVHNIIDNNYLAKQAQQYISANGIIWLGAKSTSPNVTDPNSWNWSDGTPFDYQNYQSGEPSSLQTAACMQFSAATAKWKTASCINYAPFICEYQPDNFPVTCPPTSECFLIEKYYTLIISVIKSCPSGYYYLQETQYCYKVNCSSIRLFISLVQLVIARGNFDDARSGCWSMGAELVSILSPTENGFIHDISQTGHDVWNKEQTNNIYIGLIYQNGHWQWTDGSSAYYLNWASGEPNFMKKEHWTTIFFFIVISISAVFPIPFVRFCRHSASQKCVAVDVWLGQHSDKRLFPMKCLNDTCPEGTFCDEDGKCWEEIKFGDGSRYYEMKLIDGKWK